MKLRFAKKILNSDRRYKPHHLLQASSLLIRRAYRYGDAWLAKAAFDLKPKDSFITDDVTDIRHERLEGQLARHEDPVLDPGLPSFPEPDRKPVFRKDGQVHNFAALPYPGQKPYTIMQYQARTQGKDRGKGPRRYH